MERGNTQDLGKGKWGTAYDVSPYLAALDESGKQAAKLVKKHRQTSDGRWGGDQNDT